MKNQFISLFDKFILSQQSIIEIVFRILKEYFNLEYSRLLNYLRFF